MHCIKILYALLFLLHVVNICDGAIDGPCHSGVTTSSSSPSTLPSLSSPFSNLIRLIRLSTPEECCDLHKKDLLLIASHRGGTSTTITATLLCRGGGGARWGRLAPTVASSSSTTGSSSSSSATRTSTPTRPATTTTTTTTTAKPSEDVLGTIQAGLDQIVRLDQVQALRYLLQPSQLVRKTLQFVRKQSDAAQERRDFYHKHTEQVGYSIVHPFRVMQLTATAFCLIEILEFLVGNENLYSFYKQTVQPTFQKGWKGCQMWWKKGRSSGGLFHRATWTTLNIQHHPEIIVRAWNQQFSRKSQRAMGTAVGLILSPILWALTGALGEYVVLLLLVAEANHYTGERLELWLRQHVSVPISTAWGQVDVAFERLRNAVRGAVSTKLQVIESMIQPPPKRKNGDDEANQYPEEALPMALQQGLLLGVVLGFVAGV